MKMKHYKDADNNVYGFAADGSQDHLKPEGLIEISFGEAENQGTLNSENRFQTELKSMDYVNQRLISYPEIGEFLDAWVKDDEVALEEYRQKCLAVKAKYPKPQ